MDGHHALRNALLSELPPAQRLALAYAPNSCKSVAAALLVLDARLAAALRQAREPMLAQIRLAWWREQLADRERLEQSREDCLRALAAWPGEVDRLTALVDGWEGLIGIEPPPDAAFEQLATARAVALVTALGGQAKALLPAKSWALWDMPHHLALPDAAAQVQALARAQNWSHVSLPRAARPVAMLFGLARRKVSGTSPADLTPGDALAMVRIGLFGR